ncbi:chemotaxis protein CheB [Candidatus Uabimicrobium amorphum]|uniref:histidine kinase n=1 Tax=Uabimicrobium amorphum TaxID=2596890 RepID=A0A5S9IPK4_UABAM|nr:chemotaxis protein CheB [Candidatus Uabimicrobium amorphum]BBM85738.1 protein-glutamate methylesterase [Candidatus Uabimicrobium amorphum]
MSQEKIFIAAVGASAGGIEALENLFSSLPQQMGIAFVVIQHLSPDLKSIMDEILSRRTEMEVLIVEDGMVVKQNKVYLLPPNREVIINGGILYLREKDNDTLSLPINTFFNSLAKDCGNKSIGIILSGTGRDGSKGIESIFDVGGNTIAQTPENAKFSGMPENAILTNKVKLVLNVDEIGSTLAEYIENFAFLADHNKKLPFHRIINLLQQKFDTDFSLYKLSTVKRRIERRTELKSFSDTMEYFVFLENDQEEQKILYRELLIGVTQFFRDPEAFEILKMSVIPQLIKREEKDLRIWVSACATGEEAYSIAILLDEYIVQNKLDLSFTLFATDLHEESILTASAGRFCENKLSKLSKSRIKKYFSFENDEYVIQPSLRKKIVFSVHNLLKDSPFTQMDLICCRNLLIYFEPDAKQRATSFLYFALRNNGFLFLGPSENLGSFIDDFFPISHKWKIYEKIGHSKYSLVGQIKRVPYKIRNALPVRDKQEIRLLKLYDAMLETIDIPAFIVDKSYNLVHSFPGASEYLKVKGRASFDVFSMIENHMRSILNSALRNAFDKGQKVVYQKVPLLTTEEKKFITITVEPFAIYSPDKQEYFLVKIEEQKQSVSENTNTKYKYEYKYTKDQQEHIESLQQELKYTKEYLQTTIEQQETSNEELHATNEELQAANEELHSTNEELHSVNEELHTVNSEYRRKITELAQLNNDMNNLLKSTDVSIIFLDNNFCIRKFTPAVVDIVPLLPQDIGRPIQHIHHTIQADFLDDLKQVQQAKTKIEKEVRYEKDRWLMMKIFPYHNEVGVVDGMVLKFVDITKNKKAENILKTNKERLKTIMNVVNDGYWDWKLGTDDEYLSPKFKEMFGYQDHEMENKASAWQHLIFAEDFEVAKKNFQLHLDTDGEHPYIQEVRYKHKNGSTVWVLCRGLALKDETGNFTRMVGTHTDITHLKNTEMELRNQQLLSETILQYSKMGVIVVDESGEYKHFNPQAKKILGITTTSKVLPAVHEIFSLEKSQTPHLEYSPFEKALQGEHIYEKQYFCQKFDRKKNIIVSLNAHPLHKGNITGAIVIFVDMTNHIEQMRELERSNSELDDFAYIASHDLKEPLRAISNHSSFLLEDYAHQLDEKGVKRLNRLQYLTKRMQKLITDLLHFARIGRQEFSTQETDLNLVIEDVQKTLQDQIEEQNVVITLQKKLPTILCDPVYITQVFHNLIENSIKYNDKDVKRIDIGCNETKNGNVFYVKDNGIGIDEEFYEEIFTIFKRLHSTKQHATSTGAGLTFVKKIIERLGGAIWLESELDKETTFYFTFGEQTRD